MNITGSTMAGKRHAVLVFLGYLLHVSQGYQNAPQQQGYHYSRPPQEYNFRQFNEGGAGQFVTQHKQNTYQYNQASYNSRQQQQDYIHQPNQSYRPTTQQQQNTYLPYPSYNSAPANATPPPQQKSHQQPTQFQRPATQQETRPSANQYPLLRSSPAQTQNPHRHFHPVGPHTVPVPYPGCPAAMRCVPDEYCNSLGVIEQNPIPSSKVSSFFRVARTECSDSKKRLVGVCCRDPNYGIHRQEMIYKNQAKKNPTSYFPHPTQHAAPNEKYPNYQPQQQIHRGDHFSSPHTSTQNLIWFWLSQLSPANLLSLLSMKNYSPMPITYLGSSDPVNRQIQQPQTALAPSYYKTPQFPLTSTITATTALGDVEFGGGRGGDRARAVFALSYTPSYYGPYGSDIAGNRDNFDSSGGRDVFNQNRVASGKVYSDSYYSGGHRQTSYEQ